MGTFNLNTAWKNNHYLCADKINYNSSTILLQIKYYKTEQIVLPVTSSRNLPHYKFLLEYQSFNLLGDI